MSRFPSCDHVVGRDCGRLILGVALAVTLSAIRLMPMTVSLMPELRSEKTRSLTLYFLSHFVAITTWALAMANFPRVPRELRAIYFFGIGMTIAGGCANKNLLRVGGGSLRSLVVLVFLGRRWLAALALLQGFRRARRRRVNWWLRANPTCKRRRSARARLRCWL